MIEGLLRVAKERAFHFETAAILRLGGYGPMASNAVPLLVQIVNEHNPLTRQIAIRALGQIKSQAEVAVPALMDLANDPDPGTRSMAVQALRAFGYVGPFRSPLN